MSAIRLYAPPRLGLFTGDLEPGSVAETQGPLPAVLRLYDPDPTPEVVAFVAPPGSRQSPLERAALLHRNRCCGNCGRGTPVPQCEQTNDWSRSRAFGGESPVPGVGTLRGFECEHCGHAWSV